MNLPCVRCKQFKDETQFYRTKSKAGFHHTCIPCCREGWKDYVNRPGSLRQLKGRKPYVELVTKVCTGCKQEKKIEEFDRRSGRAHGHRPKCKECNAALHKKWAAKNPSASRIRNLKSKYGLSADDYSMLLEAQDSGCAICGTKEDTDKRSLHVDHDHTTGKVRGILCRACNLGLGKLQDSIPLLKKAIAYLTTQQDPE